MSSVSKVETSAGQVLLHHLAGTSSSKLLILLANGFPAQCYTALAEALQDHFTCQALEFQGQGDTPAPQGNPADAYLQALLEVVQTQGLAGCCVFGHSMGGHLALRAEAVQPGSFCAIYAYEPVFQSGSTELAKGEKMSVGEGTDWLHMLALKRRAKFASRRAALDSFGSKAPFAMFRRDVLEAYVQHGTRQLPDGTCELLCQPSTEAACFAGFGVRAADQAALQSLQHVHCPVMIATGGMPEVKFAFLAREGPKVVALLSRAKLQRFETLFHLGPLEDPKLVGHSVLQHLQLAVSGGRQWDQLPAEQSVTQSKM